MQYFRQTNANSRKKKKHVTYYIFIVNNLKKNSARKSKNYKNWGEFWRVEVNLDLDEESNCAV